MTRKAKNCTVKRKRAYLWACFLGILKGIDGFDIDGLGVHWAAVNTEPTAGAIFFVHYRTELIKMDGLFLEGADVITGPTKGHPTPGNTLPSIDDRHPHAHLFLTDPAQGPRGADLNALHTEIAGYLFDLDQGGAGIDPVAKVEDLDGVIRTDLGTSATTDTLAGEDLLWYRSWRP